MTGEGTISNVAGPLALAGPEGATATISEPGAFASALIAPKSTDPAVANPTKVAIAPPAMTIVRNDMRRR